MSIKNRGEKIYLVRVYMGTDPFTKKRIEINETVYGTFSCAKEREAELKAQKYSGRLAKTSRMTVDVLFNRYLESARHTLGVATYHKYADFYRIYASPYIGNISIAKIKRGDIQRLFNFLLDPKEENGDKER